MDSELRVNVSPSKQRILNAIAHRTTDKIPLMYRALPPVNDYLADYFSLDRDITKSWKDLIISLHADGFSGGASLNKFTKYNPKYIGRHPVLYDSNILYSWGIYPLRSSHDELITYQINQDFANRATILEMRKFTYPKIEEFDFQTLSPDTHLRNDYMRGFEKLFVELLTQKKLAHYYIDRIGLFALEMTEKILSKIGREVDSYSMWDDLATQRGLMISHDLFKEFYLPWYKRIIAETKKYDLISFFHICGNANDIIPDLINIGVDVLDPVQVSAHDMDLRYLKREYGHDICFHGGIDVQTMLPRMKPTQITDYVREIDDLFAGDGGLILGPSHEITSDTPLHNILAAYRPELL
jgi:uroporphyrinogen decarboxylase